MVSTRFARPARYAHSVAYILSLASANGLSAGVDEPCVLRSPPPVDGRDAVAQIDRTLNTQCQNAISIVHCGSTQMPAAGRRPGSGLHMPIRKEVVDAIDVAGKHWIGRSERGNPKVASLRAPKRQDR